MSDRPVLEVSGLVCTYSADADTFAGTGRRRVIDGVSFSIGGAECLGLLGDSGSGKSTVACCIAGLREPDAGRVSVMGVNIFPERRNRKTLKGAIQMLYQDHSASLDPALSIRQSLTEAYRARRRNRIARRAEADLLVRMLEEVGLSAGMLDRYPHALSGGERQRVALARSLAVDPSLLVLDEPTSALDHESQMQILDLIASIQRSLGTAILFISHDIDAVARICSHIAVLHDGRIVESAAARDVLAHPVHPYTQRIIELHTA